MSKLYRVTGDQNFRGYKPGKTFSMNLTPEQEERALGNGQIEPLDVEGDSLESKTREELDSIAETAGVKAPASLENKAAVVQAIRDNEKG
jgi:hypothetical protein